MSARGSSGAGTTLVLLHGAGGSRRHWHWFQAELPPEVRLGMGMGLPEDVAPLFVFLASQAASHITGQCIGLGGGKLTLWSHPQEIRAAYSDSRWTAEKIAQAWDSSVGQELETFGIPMIAPPATGQ